jgi:hypothetical protein
MRFIEEDRERKPSMLGDYRSALSVHLLPALGTRMIVKADIRRVQDWMGYADIHRAI